MHFYVSATGNRGETTRGGSKASGIRSHTRGWSTGVRVVGRTAGPDELDRFDVYATHGSRGMGPETFIGHVDHAGTFHPASEED